MKPTSDSLNAAASEMYEALKWAMRHLPMYTCRIKGQNEGYCDGYDNAVALLAKVEGK